MNCENLNRNLLKAGLIGALGIMMSGCTSVPHAEFGAYQSNFDSVKLTAEDVYMRAGLLAEKKADRPESDGSITDRRKELDARKDAMAARLAALDLVDSYNRVLTGLASGTSSQDLKNQAAGLSDQLSSFNLTQVSQLLQKASPVVGVLAQGVSLVETEIQKGKFRQAVIQAQKPLIDILEILIADSNDLETIFVTELQSQQDPYRAQCDSTARRFNRRIKGLKASDAIKSALARQNHISQQWARENVQMIAYQETPSCVDATPGDVEALTALSDQAETNVLAYNKIEDEITAQHAVFDQYRKTLRATEKAFAALPSAVESTRVLATMNFVQQARELRKATLMLREAR